MGVGGFYTELHHMNKQLRGSVYSTSEGSTLCIGFLCVLQDAWFVDSLVAVSVTKAFVLRGNKHYRDVWCLCFTLGVSLGRLSLERKCQIQVYVHLPKKHLHNPTVNAFLWEKYTKHR